jgi:hypothetical protein
MDVQPVGAGNCEANRVSPGHEQQPVIAESLSVRKQKLMRAKDELDDSLANLDLDAIFFIKALVPQRAL